jgi:squalene-hopene/tetraprenyl-beta-curcumene cyclase
MKTFAFGFAAAAVCVATSLSAQTPSPAAAAAYLDARMSWWMTWPSAARDHGTFCVSCHTAAPYAMARSALRTKLGEPDASPVERKLLENVAKRVRMWKDVQPFYPDSPKAVSKTAESRGTESVFNALILARYNAPDTRLAFDNMWAEQLKTGDAKGAWAWLQFHNSPWEGDSQYYGATLAALAVGIAPGNYRDTPEIQDGIKQLRDYLQRECAAQIPIDRVTLLWASAKLPGLLTAAQQKAIEDEALSKQQADGGFSLSSFVGTWKRHDNTPLETKSDGYATGLVAYALEQAGLPRDRPELQRALAWLGLNQDKTEGRWLAYSLNKQRDLSTDVGKFMSDAATAYAVLALQGSN